MMDLAAVERLTRRLPELEARLSDPATAARQSEYRALLQEHTRLRRLKDLADAFTRLRADAAEHRALLDDEGADAELSELARAELREIEARLPAAERELMLALLPPDPDEDRDAVLEIRAGTGGSEAALFAADLFRMYSHYATAQGWKMAILDASPGEVGGYKEVTCTVEGDGAYAALRYEGGGHRVQRVPVTEAQGRIHTSAATVAVFPEVEAEDDISVPASEIRVDVYRSSGPGGQSVNRTDSAVRLTHLPTGIVVQCQDEKSQHRNKDKAMAVLKARLLDRQRREEADRMGRARRTMIGSGDRSERIRTYNFPQNRLTDHRINLTLYSLDRVMEGDLADLLDALREHDLAERLAEQGAG